MADGVRVAEDTDRCGWNLFNPGNNAIDDIFVVFLDVGAIEIK